MEIMVLGWRFPPLFIALRCAINVQLLGLHKVTDCDRAFCTAFWAGPKSSQWLPAGGMFSRVLRRPRDMQTITLFEVATHCGHGLRLGEDVNVQ